MKKEAQICINEGTEEEEKWDSGNVMFHKIPKQLEVAIKKSQNKYNDYIGIVQAFDEISGIYNYTFRENGFTKSIKSNRTRILKYNLMKFDRLFFESYI